MRTVFANRLTLAALSLSAATAHAVASNDLYDLSLEELSEVRVSVASFAEESELDVANSVARVDRADWERRGAHQVGQALETVPSVVSYPVWGGAEAITVRGYSSETSGRGIASTLDGVPLNTFANATAQYDKPNLQLPLLDRIEMIRGPGSALYGSDAFHGVLAYQTRRADYDDIEVQGEAGAPGYGQTSAFISRAVGGVRANGGVSYQYQGDQSLDFNYTDPFTGAQEEGKRAQRFDDVSGNLNLSLGEAASGRYSVGFYAAHDERDDFPGVGRQFFSTLPTVFDLESASISQDGDTSSQTSHFYLTRAGYERALAANLDLEVRAYYWQSSLEWRFDNSRYPNSLALRAFPATLPCKATSNSLTPNPLYCEHELTQSVDENRSGTSALLHQSLAGLNTDWTGGIGYDHLRIDDSSFTRIASTGLVREDVVNAYDGATRSIEYALLHAKTTFVDGRYQVVYGGRYDHYSDVGGHFSPSLGFIYRFAPAWAAKLNYAESFRAPTVVEQYGAGSGSALPNPDIEPETLDSYEASLLRQTAQQRTEFTVFRSYWDDAIVLVPTGGVTNQYQNVGENSSWGVESSHRQTLGAWRFDVSASYVRSKNNDTGLEYVAFPELSGGVGVGYHWAEPQVTLQVFERVMTRYSEADHLAGVESQESKDYYRTDVNLTKRVAPQGDVFLNIYNLFNRDNIVPALYNAEGGIAGASIAASVGARWRF